MKGKSGGVGVYISKNIHWVERPGLVQDKLECLWIEIIPPKTKSFILCVIYRPPDGSHYLPNDSNAYLSNMFSFSTSTSTEIQIMGDMNVNYLKRNNHIDVKSILSLYGFKQMIKSATRVTKETSTLIDLILTNNPHVIIDTAVIPISFSDHDLIGCVRKLNHQKFQPKTIICRSNRNYTKDQLIAYLRNSDWSEVYRATDVSTAWSEMKRIICTTLDIVAPKFEKIVTGKPCPWIITDLKMQMNERDSLLRKSRKSHNDIIDI